MYTHLLSPVYFPSNVTVENSHACPTVPHCIPRARTVFQVLHPEEVWIVPASFMTGPRHLQSFPPQTQVTEFIVSVQALSGS